MTHSIGHLRSFWADFRDLENSLLRVDVLNREEDIPKKDYSRVIDKKNVFFLM